MNRAKDVLTVADNRYAGSGTGKGDHAIHSLRAACSVDLGQTNDRPLQVASTHGLFSSKLGAAIRAAVGRNRPGTDEEEAPDPSSASSLEEVLCSAAVDVYI